MLLINVCMTNLFCTSGEEWRKPSANQHCLHVPCPPTTSSGDGSHGGLDPALGSAVKIRVRVCECAWVHMCVRCVCLGQRSPSGVHLLLAADTRWSQDPGYHTTMLAAMSCSYGEGCGSAVCSGPMTTTWHVVSGSGNAGPL